MTIKLCQATLVLATSTMVGDLLISDGKIAAIGRHIPDEADQVIDLTGKIILPGFIDPHTHMDLQQSQTFRAADDFYSGTVAAAVGGTTTIIDHIAFSPAGSPLMASIDNYHQLAKDAVIDYSFHGVIQHVDDDILAELKHIVQHEGITSFKAYSTYGFAVDDMALLKLLATMSEVGGLLTMHCENDGLTRYHNDKFGKMGQRTMMRYAQSRPTIAEAETVGRFIDWAHHLGDVPIYIVHTSAARSLQRIAAARQRGQQRIAVETCPQYLLFDDAVYQRPAEQAVQYLMAPPLRCAADQTALWQGVLAGDVQVVGTDHCPFMRAEKLVGIDDYTLAPGGVAGVQERGLVMYTEAVVNRNMSLVDFANIMSGNAAKIFGCYPQKGVIAVASDADLVVLDPTAEAAFDEAQLRSNSDFSPYLNYRTRARICCVYSKGNCIVDNGEFVGKRGDGSFIRRDLTESL